MTEIELIRDISERAMLKQYFDRMKGVCSKEIALRYLNISKKVNSSMNSLKDKDTKDFFTKVFLVLEKFHGKIIKYNI
jgi:hypothetical protein